MNALRMRGIIVVVLFALGFTVLSVRLVYLQLMQHDYFLAEAIKMHYTGVPIPPRRGSIRDKSGNVLAQTIRVNDLRVDGKLASSRPDFFEKLAPALGLSVEQLKEQVNPQNRYQLIKTELTEEELTRIRELKLKPVILSERMTRIYPNGSEASHILGFVNAVQQPLSLNGLSLEFEVGQDGMEKTMERYLKGVAGERRVVRDASKREIAAFRQSDRPARDGMDVVLTIDQQIQHIIEVETDRLVQEFKPEGVQVIVMNPSTGEILGLTNRPTFDPGNRKGISPAQLRNAAFVNTYEPGSTFKIVTLSAALNENAADLDMPIFCENGKFFYAGKWLNDHAPYGILTLRQIVARSSNIGFAKLAILLGQDKIYHYAKQFGFGAMAQPRSVALTGEEPGLLHPLKRWTPLSITRVPMGYEVAVTNLQMTLTYAAIANGGKLMEPRLVKAVLDNQGKPVIEYMPKAIRQVVRPDVATQIRDALKDVVSDEGTAQMANVPGFTVAGKTGTAQKLVGGHYNHDDYISSFIGFLPADKPEFLVSILVDRPHGKYYGGLVAAPAFSKIATQVAQQLRLNRSDTTTAFLTREDGS